MTRSTGWRFAIAALAAVALGLAYLMVSERIGRLSMDMQYDDVSYAADAADRYDAWRYGGIGGLATSLASAPTHSPYSVLLGVAAFAVLGVHQLSLYLANLLVLLAAALMVVVLTRRYGDATFGVALLLVLPSALAFHCATEFRPDPAYGLAIAAMALAFTSAAIDERPARARLAGILLGIGLLAKPTFFAHTLALAILLATLAALARGSRTPAALRPMALPWGEIAAFLAIGALVAAPYYATAGASIFGYFWSNTFGTHGHVHNLSEGLSPWQVIQAFEPYVFQLARYHLYATAIAAAALVPLLALRGLGREALRTGVLALVGLASATIILAGRQPSPFFFSSADWLFIAAAITGFAAFAAGLRPGYRNALCAATAIAILPLTWHSLQNLRGAWPPGADHADSANVRLLAAMRDDLRRLGAPTPPPMLQVMIDSSGPVNPVVLRWVARLNGMRVYGPEVHLLGELEPLVAAAQSSDYVIAIKPERAPFDQWLPLKDAQQAFEEWALHNPDLEALPGLDGTAYRLFANRAVTNRFAKPGVVAANGGIVAIKGLSAGAQGSPRTMEGPNAVACFTLPAGVPQHVTVRFTATQGGTLDLRIAGEKLSVVSLKPGSRGELLAMFTPVQWSPNCIDLHVEAAAPATPPSVSIEAFVVGPAV